MFRLAEVSPGGARNNKIIVVSTEWIVHIGLLLYIR